MAIPDRPFTKPKDFAYRPEAVAPNGAEVKRPLSWTPRNHQASSWPPGYLFNDRGQQVCGAWNSYKERVCHSASLQDNGRCRAHGGYMTARRGVNSSNWKGGRDANIASILHGRYSPYIPERLLQRYHEAQDDPDLVSVRGELVLITARIQEVLERVDQGEAGRLWLILRGKLQDYRSESDPDLRNALLMDIFQTIDQGASDYMNWQEAVSLTEQRRKLSETETKRLVAMRQHMTIEQATALISALADSINRNVHDPAALAAIRTDLGRLLTVRPSPATGPYTLNGAVSS